MPILVLRKQHTLLKLIDYYNTHLKNSLEWGMLKYYFTTQGHIKEYLNYRLRKNDIYLSELSYQFITGLEMFLRGYQPTWLHP
ncbi:MAG: phage integrase SAM-like domain-containing protein [Cyclobacteriaceae bacterium]